MFNIVEAKRQEVTAASKRATDMLPELSEKTRAFDRQNSQTTLSMMSLTMMTGQSPMRMMRQVLAEVEKRKIALAEAQLSHAKALAKIEKLQAKERTPVVEAELRLKEFGLDMLENKVNGAIKDIATLADAYENIKQTHGIGDWDEQTFETEEKRHHIRRGFELLYRNLIEYGRAKEATIEYLQQYGVHIQVALGEVSGYIAVVNQRVQNNDYPNASDMEVFFDEMADKYVLHADVVSERIFGKANFANSDYMMLSKHNDPTGD